MISVFRGRNGLRAGWAFALFVVADFLLEEGLFRAAAALGYRSPDEWTAAGMAADEAISLLAVLLATALMAALEKRSFREFGFAPPRAGILFAEGVAWGFVPSAVIVAMIAALGGATVHGLALHGWPLVESALLWWAAMTLLGLSEEGLFRGYGQWALARGIGFWPAAASISALFGGLHFFLKPNENWIDGLSVALYGLFWAFTLRRTGSLWFAIGFHAMSDYADMVVFAEPNTGNRGRPLAGHLLDVTFHGPDWLTGGPRGTEASALVFLILAALFVLFDRRFPRKSKSRPGGG